MTSGLRVTSNLTINYFVSWIGGWPWTSHWSKSINSYFFIKNLALFLKRVHAHNWRNLNELCERCRCQFSAIDIVLQLCKMLTLRETGWRLKNFLKICLNSNIPSSFEICNPVKITSFFSYLVFLPFFHFHFLNLFVVLFKLQWFQPTSHFCIITFLQVAHRVKAYNR